MELLTHLQDAVVPGTYLDGEGFLHRFNKKKNTKSISHHSQYIIQNLAQHLGPAHPNPALTYPKRTAHTDNRIHTQDVYV